MPVGGERCRLGDDGLDRRGDRPDHARKAVGNRNIEESVVLRRTCTAGRRE
jgi:hypothetical protein